MIIFVDYWRQYAERTGVYTQVTEPKIHAPESLWSSQLWWVY